MISQGTLTPYMGVRLLLSLPRKESAMAELPDIVIGYTKEHWGVLGYTPIILYRLVEHGWTFKEVNFVLKKVIGKDYANVNVSTWIDRLEDQGVEFPERISVVEILDRIILVYLNEVEPAQELTPPSEKGTI